MVLAELNFAIEKSHSPNKVLGVHNFFKSSWTSINNAEYEGATYSNEYKDRERTEIIINLKAKHSL